MTTPLRRSPRLAAKAVIKRDMEITETLHLILNTIDAAPTLDEKMRVSMLLFEFLKNRSDFLRRHQNFRIQVHLFCQIMLKKNLLLVS